MKWFFLLIWVSISQLGETQELIPFLKGELYGFSDEHGNLQIPALYDEVSLFNEYNYANVRKGQYWSIITSSGVELLPFEFTKPVHLAYVLSKNELSFPYYRQYQQQRVTLTHLRQANADNLTAQLINLKDFSISEKFTRKKHQSEVSSGFANPNVIHYRFGIYIGRIHDELYHVLDEEGNVLLQTTTLPRLLNEQYLTYRVKEGCILYQISTGISTSYPYFSIVQIVKDKYLIVEGFDTFQRNFSSEREHLKGLITLEEKIQIKPVYESLEYYPDDILIACRDNKCLGLNVKGQKTSHHPYLKIYPLRPGFYKAMKSDSLWYLLGKELKPLSNKPYSEIKQAGVEKYFTYRVGNSYGILDSNLTMEMEMAISEGALYRTGVPGFYHFERNGLNGIIHRLKGEIIPPMYTGCQSSHKKYFILELNNRKGLADTSGQILFEPIYENMIVENRDGLIYFHPEQNGYYATFDEQFQLLEGFINKSARSFMLAEYKLKGWLGNQFDRLNHEVTEVTIPDDSMDLYVVEFPADSFYRVFRKDGMEITNDSIRIVRHVYPYESGLFIAQYDNKLGMINHLGQWLIAPEYDEFDSFEEAPVIARTGNDYHLFSLTGTPLSPHGYTYVYKHCNGNLIVVQRDSKEGCLQLPLGNMIIPIMYDNITCYESGFVGSIGTEKGQTQTNWIDITGHTILSTPFDGLYPIPSEGKPHLLAYSYYDKQGVIKMNGEILLEPVFYRIGGFMDTVLFSYANEKCERFIMNRKGEILYPGDKFNRMKPVLAESGKWYFIGSEEGFYLLDNEGSILNYIGGEKIEREEKYLGDTKLLRVENGEKTYYLNGHTLIAYRSD